VLTGPGLAREAGFDPFAAAGMPSGLSLQDVVTPEGFAREPERVQGFYNARRRQLLTEATPSAAHEALSVLEMVRKNEVLIVTRNIDDLHERANSLAVLHTHGEMLKARCQICTNTSAWLDDITPDSVCPVCGNVGHLRPHVVWVGEPPLRMETVYEAVSHCPLLLVIGASVAAEPWAGLVADAGRAGARAIEFSHEAAPCPDLFDERISGPLNATVPAYVKQLIAES
jgi:NAD-dependent protein deacetylase/lipoamidase